MCVEHHRALGGEPLSAEPGRATLTSPLALGDPKKLPGLESTRARVLSADRRLRDGIGSSSESLRRPLDAARGDDLGHERSSDGRRIPDEDERREDRGQACRQPRGERDKRRRPAPPVVEYVQRSPAATTTPVDRSVADTRIQILRTLESAKGREPAVSRKPDGRLSAKDREIVARYRAQTILDIAGTLQIRGQIHDRRDALVKRMPSSVVNLVRETLKEILGRDYSEELLPKFMRTEADLNL